MKNKTIVFMFISLIVVYVALALLLPSDPSILAKYDITQSQARLLNLTIVFPLVGIWLSALYGYIRFKKYATLVNNSPEGPPLHTIAAGLFVLALSLPINAILSSITSYLVLQNPNNIPVTAIIKNYSAMIFTLVAFILLANGTKKLLFHFKFPDKQHPFIAKYTNLLLILLTSIFNWIIITRPLNQQNGASIYYLPSFLIVATLAVPYVYAWHQGLMAAARLYLYVNKIRGVVYKQAFSSLAKGVGIVVFVSILIQLITTLSARLNRLNLTPLLVVIYVLLLLYALGYGYIARGAKKLKQIEEA